MFYQKTSSAGQSFSEVRNACAESEGLPFSDVLSEEQIQRAFAEEGALFGEGEKVVYTPSITLWAHLSQVLHTGPFRSCAAAVSRVIVLCVVLGRRVPSEDTGAYCRARAKIPVAVVRRLAKEVASALESQVPPSWLWKERHAKMVDGTTLSPCDTVANQEKWPQPPSQKAGIGFPILRMVGLLSLATGAVCDLEMGPYEGKETGEPALLRAMLDRLEAKDILLGDCCFCSYFMIALLLARKVDVVFRQHQRRTTDFRRGRSLGREDHVVVWEKPERPEWMDEETYAQIPETLTVRELKVRVHIRGFRTQTMVVVTTLTDARHYPKSEVAGLYRARWHVELDLRSLKCALDMEDLRGKSPEMVEREIWTHCLAYNLIRKKMAQAAFVSGRPPRSLSFTAALQAVSSAWMQASTASPETRGELTRQILKIIAGHRVGQRPNRVEPRAVKRRPKSQKLLTKPRDKARAELLKHTP